MLLLLLKPSQSSLQLSMLCFQAMPLASGSHLDFPDTDMSYFQTPGVAMSHYLTLGGPTFALKYNERHVRYALSQMLHHRKDKTIHYDTHVCLQQALFFFPSCRHLASCNKQGNPGGPVGRYATARLKQDFTPNVHFTSA